jgi:hypothetical protein
MKKIKCRLSSFIKKTAPSTLNPLFSHYGESYTVFVRWRQASYTGVGRSTEFVVVGNLYHSARRLLRSNNRRSIEDINGLAAMTTLCHRTSHDQYAGLVCLALTPQFR